MTRSPNDQMAKQLLKRTHHRSDFVIPSSLDIRHSSLQSRLIATDAQLTELLKKIDVADRAAIDTEADSLHCYREKLWLLQISVPAAAGVVDAGRGLETAPGNRDPRSRLQHHSVAHPLAGLDLEPLRQRPDPSGIF